MESTLGPNHPQAKAQKAQIDELTRRSTPSKNGLCAGQADILAARTNEDQTAAALEPKRPTPTNCATIWWSTRFVSASSNPTAPCTKVFSSACGRRASGRPRVAGDRRRRSRLCCRQRPIFSRSRPLSLTSCVLRVCAGVVLAFLMESLDTGLRSVAEIESITELPSLAIIPRARRPGADAEAKLSTASAISSRSDAAEVAVRRSLPFAAHVAAAIYCRASAEVHPAHQRDPV